MPPCRLGQDARATVTKQVSKENWRETRDLRFLALPPIKTLEGQGVSGSSRTMGISSQLGYFTQVTQSAQILGCSFSRGNSLKPEAAKKVQAIGEHEDLPEAQGAGLGEAIFHQAPADAPALAVRRHHNGADFPQILPEHVEGGDALDVTPTILPADKVIPHVTVQFRQGAGQDVPPAGAFPQKRYISGTS